MGTARGILALLFLTSSVACSPAEPTSLQADAVEPDPNQVLFYERPLTLAAVKKSELPAPIVVLLERDPWAMVVGSDSPKFALYEDGMIIQRTDTGYSKARLTEAELTQFLEQLELDAIHRFYGRYVTSDWTDQPEQALLVYRGEKPTFVSVYGSLNEPEVRAKVPREIVTAYDRLSAFSHSRSEAWFPEYVEVMIWPYEYAPGPSIHWPEGWPGLSDPKTERRGEDSFSIFIPSAQLAELRSFLKRRSDKGAIEIDGRKWAASTRFPFPHESLWVPPQPELSTAKR